MQKLAAARDSRVSELARAAEATVRRLSLSLSLACAASCFLLERGCCLLRVRAALLLASVLCLLPSCLLTRATCLCSAGGGGMLQIQSNEQETQQIKVLIAGVKVTIDSAFFNSNCTPPQRESSSFATICRAFASTSFSHARVCPDCV